MSQKYLHYLIKGLLKPKISRRVHQMVHKWERRNDKKETMDAVYDEWFARQRELRKEEEEWVEYMNTYENTDGNRE